MVDIDALYNILEEEFMKFPESNTCVVRDERSHLAR